MRLTRAQSILRLRLRRLPHRTIEALPRLCVLLRQTLASFLDHDALNIAQSAAYSSLVSLFPALIVSAAVITWLPDNASIRLQAALFFDRILPPDVSPLLESYFENGHRTPQSTEAILVAAVVSLIGASGVIVTLMEGFRRAFDLAPNIWGFWEKRWRSLALVPIAIFPLALASILIIFGHVITERLAAPFATLSLGRSLHSEMLVVVMLLRWIIALASSVGIIGAIYHMGVPPFCLGEETPLPPHAASLPISPYAASAAPSEAVGQVIRTTVQTTVQSPAQSPIQSSLQSTLPIAVHNSVQSSVFTLRAMSTLERSWKRTLPGAFLATVLWFVTTLGFGLYVTRFANYSQVYGPLGAGIALLFWLYILSLSILFGAEFNARLYEINKPPVEPTEPAA